MCRDSLGVGKVEVSHDGLVYGVSARARSLRAFPYPTVPARSVYLILCYYYWKYKYKRVKQRIAVGNAFLTMV